jgi:hypothetical protein
MITPVRRPTFPEEITVADLKPRPCYHAQSDLNAVALAARLKKSSEADGPTDYATRINLEILAQLVAIRRHALVLATVVVTTAVLSLILFFVLLGKLPDSVPSRRY